MHSLHMQTVLIQRESLQIYIIQRNFLSPQLVLTRIFTGNLTEPVMNVPDAHDETYLIERILTKEKWIVKNNSYYWLSTTSYQRSLNNDRTD